jgi:hypothetical protein
MRCANIMKVGNLSGLLRKSALFLGRAAYRANICMQKRRNNACLRILAALSLLTALLFAGGCSTFNYDWHVAQQTPLPNDLQGRWQGVWVSQATGHKNELRCLVTKLDDATYQARFHAKYRKGLLTVSFNYTVPLKVEKADDTFKFTGDADLGKLAGGLYHYDGHAAGTNFFSTYSCKYDHGTFQMTRP